MVVPLEVSPISTQDLWSSTRVTTGFLVTSLTRALLPRLLSLARWTALGRVLIVPNFFHLRIMEATVLLKTFDAAKCVLMLGFFPGPMPPHNPVSELCRQFLQPYGLVFTLICIVSCQTLYRQVCAFVNHVQSINIDHRWTPIKV